MPFVITILQCGKKIVEGHLETQEPIIMVDEEGGIDKDEENS